MRQILFYFFGQEKEKNFSLLIEVITTCLSVCLSDCLSVCLFVFTILYYYFCGFLDREMLRLKFDTRLPQQMAAQSKKPKKR
jgi:hypothetical protein